jgi:endonuclease/exonuclease/phosphatase family metal-dependent hydrolase
MPSTIRVATYNLYLGADVTVVFGVRSPEELAEQARVVLDQVVATDFAQRAEAIAALLVGERVDLVGLQEVARWSREVSVQHGEERTEVWLDFLRVLLDALARAGQAYDVHARTANFRGGAHVEGREAMGVLGHNVVLVRRGSHVRVLAEQTGDFARTLDIVTGMPALVLNVARSWGWVDAEVDGRPLRFVNTHTEAWDEQVRNAQRDELIAAVGDPGRPVVVVGDFNAAPEQVGMPEEYVDAWVVAGRGGEGLTCGQSADLTGDSGLDVRIDYVWVRGDAEVTACWVVGHRPEDRTRSGLWPSDHAGVVAEIAF